MQATATTTSITLLVPAADGQLVPQVFTLTANDVRYVLALDAMVIGSFKAVRHAAKIQRIAAGDDCSIALHALGLLTVPGGYVRISHLGKRVAHVLRQRAEREAKLATYRARRSAETAEWEAQEVARITANRAERDALLAVHGVRRVA